MSPETSSAVYDLDGSKYQLRTLVGKGGEGSIWSLDGKPSIVAKLYHEELSTKKVQKLEAMLKLDVQALESVAAWPLALLKLSRTGRPQGVLIRRLSGYSSIHQLYGIKTRLKLFPEAQFSFLLHTAINTARAFATVHSAGQVVGDVNHSNLMISAQGTVAMIDCDSFQIVEGTSVFPCEVGVPEFTPPELQGQTFVSQPRTTQHDAFGLAVLIFYLLFLGRHPFMGAYDARADEMLTLDHAIGEYKFPYALPAQSPEVRLPPFVPRLSDYPSSLGTLFGRAFTREALSRGRPSATEWVTALTNLSAALKACSRNATHEYFAALKECPWCRVEGVIGTAIFGVKIAVVRDHDFNLVAVWAQIEAVTPVIETFIKPEPSAFLHLYQISSGLPELIRKRRTFRLASVGLVLLISLLAVSLLSALPAIVSIVAALLVARKMWANGAMLTKSFRDAYSNEQISYKRAESDFAQCLAVPASFSREKQRLTQIRAALESLPRERAKKLEALDAAREMKQRQHFLERFRIEDEHIAGIGPKNKLILKAWGVEDAWDIDLARLRSIKGFGPVKQQTLLAWRQSKEQQFRFDPRKPVDPRDLHSLEQDIQTKSIEMKKALNAGPQVLRQILSVWQAQRRQAFTTLTAATQSMAHAEVDRIALRRF